MTARIAFILTLLAVRSVQCAPCEVRSALVVKLFNDVQLGKEVLQPAESHARLLLSSLCVDVNWSHCKNATFTKPVECENPSGRIELHLLGLPLVESRQDALGLAILDSSHAAAYVSRIREVAVANPSTIDLPVLLGYVIAHELGHVVLHSNAHPKLGIMAGDFGPWELALMGQLRLKFTKHEQDAARSRLTAKHNGTARTPGTHAANDQPRRTSAENVER